MHACNLQQKTMVSFWYVKVSIVATLFVSLQDNNNQLTTCHVSTTELQNPRPKADQHHIQAAGSCENSKPTSGAVDVLISKTAQQPTL